MKYITNIDTLSALLDRLISENIKLYFFKKDSLMYNVTRAVRDEWTQADAARDHRLYQQPLEGL